MDEVLRKLWSVTSSHAPECRLNVGIGSVALRQRLDRQVLCAYYLQESRRKLRQSPDGRLAESRLSSKVTTILSRCESLEPPMSQLGSNPEVRSSVPMSASTKCRHCCARAVRRS